jgi:hypothetical protein
VRPCAKPGDKTNIMPETNRTVVTFGSGWAWVVLS